MLTKTGSPIFMAVTISRKNC